MPGRSATTTSVSPTRSPVRIDRELGVSCVEAGRAKRDIELAVFTDQLSRVGSCQGGGIVSEGRAGAASVRIRAPSSLSASDSRARFSWLASGVRSCPVLLVSGLLC
jgi:hypothetical protein